MKVIRQMIPRVTLFLIICFSTLANAEPNIIGSYKCTGYDPFKKVNYNSEFAILKTGETYQMKWLEVEENIKYAGTGFFSRTAQDLLVAEFWNTKNPNISGVIIFQVNPDNTLEGSWTFSDKHLIGYETCKKIN